MSSEATYLDIISGRRTGLAAGAARVVLGACEPVYRAAVGFRNAAFDRRLRQAHRVSAPVVSVGNLTTGGTGKTPVVAALVNELRRRGARPGIASRGYRSLDAGGNDEQRVLNILCPGTPHRQNRDRVQAAQALIQIDGCDVIILDDGFQHRRLQRDLDVVLIDATNPWGYGRLLPRGLLREPIFSLARAGLVVITRSDLVTESELLQLRETIRRCSSAQSVVSRFAPLHIRDAKGSQTPIERLRGTKVVACCGIGNPPAFRSTIEALGAEIPERGFFSFPDHHAYTALEAESLWQSAAEQGADLVVCTLKDLVKLSEFQSAPESVPVVAVDIGLEISSGCPAWDARIDAIWPLGSRTSSAEAVSRSD